MECLHYKGRMGVLNGKREELKQKMQFRFSNCHVYQPSKISC